MHENGSMKNSNFEQWTRRFVHETMTLRAEVGSIVLCLDGFSGHIPYRDLSALKENGINAVALSDQTSHRTQPIDVSIFSPMKTHV